MTTLQEAQSLQLSAHTAYRQGGAWQKDPDVIADIRRSLSLPRDPAQLTAIGPAHFRELKAVHAAALRTFFQGKLKTRFLKVLQKATTPAVRLVLIKTFWHRLGCMPPGMLQELRRLFSILGTETGRTLFNSEAELSAWAALPDPVPLFRGALEGDGEEGLSWSPNIGVALYFAVWRSRQASEAGINLRPLILVGTVRKAAVFGMHSEAPDKPEVIAYPACVEVVEKLPVEEIITGKHARKIMRYAFGIDADRDPEALPKLLKSAARLKADLADTQSQTEGIPRTAAFC